VVTNSGYKKASHPCLAIWVSDDLCADVYRALGRDGAPHPGAFVVPCLGQQLAFSSEIVEGRLYFMPPSVEEIPCSLKLVLIVHQNELCHVDRMSARWVYFWLPLPCSGSQLLSLVIARRPEGRLQVPRGSAMAGVGCGPSIHSRPIKLLQRLSADTPIGYARWVFIAYLDDSPSAAP
jgi:hypothetical protein